MIVEEDGDEVFTPVSAVKCCRIGFEGDKPVYSKLVPVERNGYVYMCCDTCGGSYGEAPQGTVGAISTVELHYKVMRAMPAKQADHIFNLV